MGRLCIVRHEGEKTFIGDNIIVEVVRIYPDKVRLVFEAPNDVMILRDDARQTEPKHSRD